MFNWAKQQLANVAGTQEPIYGPSAIKSVAEEADKTPYTELGRDGFRWQEMDSTCVETQVFYLMSDQGKLGMVQIIYSNVAGIRTSSQFNCKIFSDDKNHLWCSTTLDNVDISADKNNFYADDLAVELSKDGNTYTIKSANDERAIVNLTISKAAPAWHAGTTGKTLFGTDLENPWGSMRHAFWPRCRAEGTITTKDGAVDFAGKALHIYCLQGMKPHHAAASWTFADFQGPTYSAIMMQFITPPSYGSTIVNVACIAKDDNLIMASSSGTSTHISVRDDSENEWPEPEAANFTWKGETKDSKAVEGVIEGPLGERADKVDVMAEVPVFLKKIVGGVVGTKPYIYQYNPTVTLKLKIGDEEITEEGHLFSEATFISE